MSPIYIHNGKLLIKDGALAANAACCCKCTNSTCSGISCDASNIFTTVDCDRAGIHKHTITIPDEYTLPVPINISGGVDDDLLIDGQSITTDLGLDPGPYPAGDPNCVGAHNIGDQPGPFKDPNGGITFPMNNRTFEVSLRDTMGGNANINITICLDPNNTQNICLPPVISGCCLNGIDLYCYEKTITVPGNPSYDCISRICSTDIPAGEEGWSQVGGPYNCDCDKLSEGCACIDCAINPTCIAYTGWKIIDQSDFVYASGSITYDGGNGLLNDLPNPFTPLFYETPGTKNFKLQGYCSGGGAWHNLEPWDGTIVLCSGVNDRYPSRNLSGPWAPQGACSKPVNEDGDFVCDINGQSSSSCPFLVPGTAGDGQAWRDPDHTIAVTFTGAEDTEWTNLANWQDANGNSPAASLPNSSSDVVIQSAIVVSVPSGYPVVLNSLTLNNNAVFSIPANVTTLTVNSNSTIGRNSSCPNMYGDITATNATFNQGYLNGRLTMTDGTNPAYFNNGSEISNQGILVGDGIFNSSRNIGIVKGDATFNGDDGGNFCAGTIEGDATFNNNTFNDGDIGGNATFNDTSNNSGGNCNIINIGGNLLFKNTSTNTTGSNPVVGGTVTFEDSSSNRGKMSSASFTETSYNAVNGIMESATFSGSSYNAGTINSTTTTSFADNSYNTGTVNGDASIGSGLTSTSYNSGTITGAVQFIGTGYNSGSVGAGSIFNGNTYNNGTAGNLTIFTGDSYNNTGGVVNGNASFNSNSRNKGNVTGTASFAWPGACNDGGTAGTFIPPDANCV